MKKIVAILTALFMCLTCVNVMAAEATPDEASLKSDTVFGAVGEYTLLYKAPESRLENYKSIEINNYYFHTKSEVVPFYFVKGSDEIPIEQAVEKGIDNETLKEALNRLKEAANSDLEPFKSGNVLMTDIFSGQEESAPGEVETCAPIIAPTTIAPTEKHNIQPDTKMPAPPTTEAPEVTVAPIEKPTKSTDVKEKTMYERGENDSSSVIPSLNIRTATLKCGKRIDIKVKNKGNKKVEFTSSNKKAATVNKKGVVTTLRKGRSVITVKVGKRKLKCIVKVTSNPKIAPKSIKVKKGKTVSIKIIGKAKGVNNKYKNTKYAKVISKKSAAKITIKGCKRGKSTLKIVVNKMTLKLKVKVK